MQTYIEYFHIFIENVKKQINQNLKVSDTELILIRVRGTLGS